MELPFTSPLAQGFGQGKSLIIRGRPHHANAWFAITLMDGIDILKNRHDNPKRVCALQVQARLDDNMVVLNTHDSSSWGREERSKPGFRVKHDSTNEIKITCNGACYEIHFNGCLFATYSHRVNKNNVTHFNFYGDFKVQEVVYI